MNLVIDIGNTQYKIAVFEGNNMMYHGIATTFEPDKFSEILNQFVITNIIFSDTRGINKSVFLEKLPKSIPVIELTHNTNLPIALNYVTIETLGKDRIAGAAAAAEIFPNQHCLIIDIGTAITFDFLNSNGVFQGGNISPGPETRLKALHHFTGKLPLVDFSLEPQFMGKTTETAIQYGVQNGILYEINGYISRLQEEYQTFKVIITGGYSFMFDKKINYPIFADSFLVLKGLNRILNYNV